MLPARISDESDWANLYSTRSSAYARKNDGSGWIWKGMTGTNQTSIFVQETNVDNQWLSLDFCYDFSHLEVKTNGDLWYYGTGDRPRQGPVALMANPHTEQLGRNMKWKTAAFGPLNGIQTIVAIRNDNTIWAIPLIWSYPSGQSLQEPIQLGNHADWLDVTSGFTLASDGSLWTWHLPPERVGLWNDHRALLAPSRKPDFMGNVFQATEATP